jgi:hypothetical protein
MVDLYERRWVEKVLVPGEFATCADGKNWPCSRAASSLTVSER